ncbi:DUF4429 domain-containing protein [Enterococcus nangangensis]|uniref:DUF4429 domain-containing protein n=1 Tax=Enterococcus nangangensis TaxID=2559926 RepID=UPI0010F68765|nr:DUF4429 domain-containing protein [Enterococcus nangangensis]
MELKGTNGTVIVDDETITISRKSLGGWAAQGFKGDKKIYFRDIVSIEFKKPTKWANGYIQFVTSPELATDQQTNFMGGTSLDALKDPNSVVLRAMKKEKTEAAEAFYDYVMDKFRQAKRQGGNVIPPISVTEELRSFKSLFDEGVITEKEFEAKKKELLGL